MGKRYAGKPTGKFAMQQAQDLAVQATRYQTKLARDGSTVDISTAVRDVQSGKAKTLYPDLGTVQAGG